MFSYHARSIEEFLGEDDTTPGLEGAALEEAEAKNFWCNTFRTLVRPPARVLVFSSEEDALTFAAFSSRPPRKWHSKHEEVLYDKEPVEPVETKLVDVVWLVNYKNIENVRQIGWTLRSPKEMV